MAADGEVDTTRTAVKTYVPAYQRDAWDEHAGDLDMSRSEFIRSMVQAGRRGFDPIGTTGNTTTVDDESEPESPAGAQSGTQDSRETTSQVVESFEGTVIGALEESEFLSWDDLLEALTTDIEDRLEETLQDLQADNQVRYSGPNGGYTLDE